MNLISLKYPLITNSYQMLPKFSSHSETKSLRHILPDYIPSISSSHSSYNHKSTASISPFIRQLKIFEQRTSTSTRNARDKYKQQSKQYKMKSASILKETKQMINDGSSVSFCDAELMKVMEENDCERERELDIVERIRRFRSKQREMGATKWLDVTNTSVRTQKLKVLEERCKLKKDKQNQIPQPLKTFLGYKKSSLRMKPISL